MSTTTSAGYAKAIIGFAVGLGADEAKLSQRVSIKLAEDFDPDSRVPFAEVIALFRAAADELADPAFALKFGSESEFSDMSIVGLITHTAETMGEAFEQLNRFAKLAVEVDGHALGPRFAITEVDGKTWLEDKRLNPNAFPELTESTWARFIANTARYFGNAPFAKSVLVTHEKPAHAAAYQDVMKVPVTFSAPRNAIEIAPSWLQIKLPSPNRYVFGIFSKRAEELLAKLSASTTIHARVEAALIPILHKGTVTMTRIARQLGLSRTSLYRQLKNESTTFDELFDALRHNMALHYLGAQKASVNETAYLVGFSDAASFSRAFKRWTGQSPSKYVPKPTALG